MKITILQGAFLPVPPKLGGAVEKVWFQLGMEFARKGHDVVHISRAYSSLPPTEVISSVRHRRARGYASTNNLMLLKFRDLKYSLRALKAAPPADLLVTNSFFAPILAKRRPELGRIYVHVARYPKGQLRFYNGVARLQTVTTAIKSAMMEQVPQLAPIMSVVPYPIELPSSRQIPSRAKPQNAEGILLYTGRVAPEKGISLLIKAFQRFRSQDAGNGWRLRIVGPWKEEHGGGGGRFLRELKQESQPISNYIDWVGPIFDKDKLADEYASATLFCYPSLAEKGETFGLAPLEAMSHGCPAIVSDLACFKDFIEDGSNGVIFDHRCPDAEKALSQAIANTVSDNPQLSNLSQQARRTAERFSYGTVAELYLNDFRKVLER